MVRRHGGNEELTDEQKAAAAERGRRVLAENDVVMDVGPPEQPVAQGWVQPGSLEQGRAKAAAAWRRVAQNLGNNVKKEGGRSRRTRRRHRTHKSRRRGGYDETKTKRRRIAKLMLEEASRRRRAARNQAEMARLVEARRRYAEGRKA